LTTALIGCDWETDELEYSANIIFNRQSAEDRAFLGQVADSQPRALVHRQMGNICPVETDRALVGGNQAGDHIEHRRFASAIGSEKTYGFTAP
jgi:hypothetical protein